MNVDDIVFVGGNGTACSVQGALSIKGGGVLNSGSDLNIGTGNFTVGDVSLTGAGTELNIGNSRLRKPLATTVRLISRFGFNAKNVVAPLTLSIALFLLKEVSRCL